MAPRARVVSLGLAGVDPVMMLHGPIPATQQALDKAGLTMEQIDLVRCEPMPQAATGRDRLSRHSAPLPTACETGRGRPRKKSPKTPQGSDF